MGVFSSRCYVSTVLCEFNKFLFDVGIKYFSDHARISENALQMG